MVDLLNLLVIVGMNAAFPSSLVLLVFLLDRWDRKRPSERRDAWGAWGLVLALAIVGLGSVLLPLGVTLTVALQEGLSAQNLLVTGIQGVGVGVFLLVIHWSLREHRRRVEAGLGSPDPGS